MTNITNSSEKNASDFWKSNFVSLATLIVLITTLCLMLWIHYYDNRLGKLVIHRPSGYCIIRGFPQFEHYSDYLVVTVSFENTGVGVKKIDNIKLELIENNSSEKVNYEMCGIIPSLVAGEIGAKYFSKYGLSLSGKTAETYNLLFRHEYFWKEGSPGEKFRFLRDQSWKANLSYNYKGKNVNWREGQEFFTMPIYKTIDKLETKIESYHSSCFSFE